MLSLPRVGQEVIVSFQEGDPDQPIITGRVYNALQVPPGHLPQSKTQMTLKSKTYKGEGYNSIMFDDATHIGLQEKELNVPENTGEFNSGGEIIDLYWSYGDSFTKLEDISRHYVDLNLHIVKENGRPGDQVEATIEYEGANGKEVLTVCLRFYQETMVEEKV